MPDKPANRNLFILIGALVVLAIIITILAVPWGTSRSDRRVHSPETAEPSPEPLVPEGPVAIVSGRVVCTEPGKSIGDTRIECGSATTTADAHGAFRLAVPVDVEPPEHVMLDVSCIPRDPRFSRQTIKDVRLVQGEETGELLFEIAPGTSSIEGVIVEGQDRQPVSGPTVRLYERNPKRPYYVVDDWRFILSTESDNGTFSFDGLRPGMYYCEAVLPQWNCPLTRKEFTLPDQAEPHRFRLYVGTKKTRILTGVITGPEGEPVNGALFWVIESGRYLFHPGISNAEGRYGLQVYLKPSQLELGAMIFHTDYQLKFISFAAEDERVISQDVSLTRAERVAGVVTDLEGNPLSNVTMRIEGEALGMETPEWFWYLPNPRMRFTTGDDGAYAFGYLPPGKYVISAKLEKYLPVERTIQVGTQGEQRCDIILDKGAAIRGTVYDENGKPLEIKSVVAAGPDGEVRCSAPSGADGTFTLKPLVRDEPVDVLVLVDELNMGSGEPFYYAKVEGVQPGREDLRIDAKPIQRGTLEIEVLDAESGDPVAAYKVWPSSYPRSGVKGLARRFVLDSHYGRADVKNEQGRVTLAGLVPGPHTFTVWTETHKKMTSEPVEVPSGGTVSLRFELKPRREREN